MRRITVLLLAMAMCLGSVAAAKADGIDIKVKGQWDFAFGWVNNVHFKDSVNRSTSAGGIRKTRDNDNFMARHRIRTQINFITSEYLQGVLMFEIGDLDWGHNPNGRNDGARTGRSTGGALDADGVNIETKRAYLDWIIPYTEVSVRMGIQGVTLPSTPMGSPVFDADVAGIVVSSPITDWLSVTALWMRPFNAYLNDSDSGLRNDSLDDETDAFGILLPMNFSDLGLSITPWFIYGFVGANSGAYDYLFVSNSNAGRNYVYAEESHSNVYWIGTHLEFTLLDPLVFNIEGIYGHLRKTDLSGLGNGDLFDRSQDYSRGYSSEVGTSGWYVGATLDYKISGDGWSMTPGLFGWYASGDKEDSAKTGKLGRLPVLGNDGGSFGPTSFGSAGYYGIAQWSNNGSVTGTGTGTWGVGIQLADVTFIKDLSHTLRFAYYRGTNDAELVRNSGGRGNYYMYTADRIYLTDEDSVFEVNFDHKYKIYENLTAVLELGWLHLKSDDDTWRRYANTTNDIKDNDNAWKAQLSFRYSF